MATPDVSKESLRGLATLLGVQISDEKLDELLPQIRQATASMSELDELVSGGAEPAIIFTLKQE